MKLKYYKDRYMADGTTAIRTFIEEDGYIEPYGDVSVCLAGYGLKPQEGCIYMPTYKMPEKYLKQVLKDIVDEVIGEVKIGYGDGLYVRLKKDWESLVEMYDDGVFFI